MQCIQAASKFPHPQRGRPAGQNVSKVGCADAHVHRPHYTPQQMYTTPNVYIEDGLVAWAAHTHQRGMHRSALARTLRVVGE